MRKENSICTMNDTIYKYIHVCYLMQKAPAYRLVRSRAKFELGALNLSDLKAFPV